MINAKIDYPTITLLENFLQKVYRINNLYVPVQKLGLDTEQFDGTQLGKFESLSPIVVNSITGIDVPVLLSRSNSNKGTVAIVAQDPLRNRDDKLLEKFPFDHPIVGTPFGVHYDQSVCPQTVVYRLIIKGLLDKGFDVYVTDAHKIYPQPRIKGLKTKEIEVLKKEIDDRKPTLIVTFGSAAKDYVSTISTIPNSTRVLHLLHPSQTNWDHWKQWIFEQAFFGNMCYNVNWTKYAGQIGYRGDMFDKYKKHNMHEIIANIVLEML